MAEPKGSGLVDILKEFGTSLFADLVSRHITKPREVLSAPGTTQAISDTLALDTDYDNEIKALEDRVRKKRKAMRSWGAKLRYATDPDLKAETEKNVAAMEAQIVELKRLKNEHKNRSVNLLHDEKQVGINRQQAEINRANAADTRADETHRDQLEQARTNRTQAAEKHQRELLEKDIELKKRNVEFEKMKKELDPPASGSLEEAQLNVKLKEAEIELKKKQKELNELTATPAVDPLDAQKKEIEKAKIEQELKKEQIALLELQQREDELKKPTAPDPHADVKRQTEEAKLKAELADAQMKELEAEKRKRELTTPATPDPHKALREEIAAAELEVKKLEWEARKKQAEQLQKPKQELTPAELSAINRQIGLIETHIRGLEQERTAITRNQHYLSNQSSVDRVRVIDNEIKKYIKQIDAKVKELSGAS